MDKKTIIRELFEKKGIRDYTYSILFFLISSFFLIFAIRPALSIAFTLKREVVDLRQVNQVYEENILKLIEIQSTMERIRDKIYLLTAAVKTKPDIYNFTTDIQHSANNNNITVNNMDIAGIPIKKSSPDKKIKTITVTLQTVGTYQGTRNFIKTLMDQRRLKTIKKIQIIKSEPVATDSAALKVVTDIEAYYL